MTAIRLEILTVNRMLRDWGERIPEPMVSPGPHLIQPELRNGAGMARCAVPVAERSARRRSEWGGAGNLVQFVPPATRGRGQRSALSIPFFAKARFEIRVQGKMSELGLEVKSIQHHCRGAGNFKA